MAWVELGRDRVHAAEWGQGNEPPTIVCVHGLGGSHLNWALLGPRLGRRARVWAVDLPGFGLSPLGDRRADLAGNVEVLTEIVAAVSPGRPVVLIGNSMGGLLSIMVAARRPELVTGITLVNPALPVTSLRGIEPAVVVTFAMLLSPGIGSGWLRWWRSRATPEQQVRRGMHVSVADLGVLDDELLASHTDLAARRREMRHADTALLQAARSLVRRMTLGADAIWREVAAVRAPALLIQGARDRITEPSTGRQLAATHPTWRHREYDDLGHLAMLEAPDRIARDIDDWLAATQAR